MTHRVAALAVIAIPTGNCSIVAFQVGAMGLLRRAQLLLGALLVLPVLLPVLVLLLLRLLLLLLLAVVLAILVSRVFR